MRLAAVVLLVCTFVSTASAQPGQTPPAPYTYQPPPQPYPQPATRTDRYGTTIAIVDGVSMAAIVVGAIVFVEAVIDDENDSDSDGALGGVGFLAAMIIDWVWLAKREVAVTYAYPSPYVGSTRDGGLTFGLAGRF